ncbi:MAG: putative collagen-binding domain-containing protein, partial [Thermoanaerobaculia bacterium]
VSGTNVYCVAEPGKHYLIYLDEGAPSQTTVDLSDTTTVLPATWLDPDTGERRDAGSFTPGSSKTFTTPFGRPAVLYIGAGEDGGPGGVFDLVFADGFEPGSTSSWSLVVN